jgi:predicted SAM-dependent methyltransferase
MKYLHPRRWLRRARRLLRQSKSAPPRRSRPLADALATVTGPLRIHVGAGPRRLPGWINTDIDGKADYYLDVLKPWPVSRGRVSHIFADNVVEHLTLEGNRAFFRHAMGAMAPGGTIRLTTPDAEATARMYLSDPHPLMERHRRHGYEVTYPVDLLRIAFTTSGHHLGYPFDETSLRAELVAAGFVEIRRCRSGQSDDPGLRGLETRAEPIEDAVMLTLEADAPSGRDTTGDGPPASTR